MSSWARTFAVASFVTTLSLGESNAQERIAGRACHGMTAVPAQGGVVAFGGAPFCGQSPIPDSSFRVWNGVSWLTPFADFPAPREDAMLAYDTRRRVLVLIGGRAGSVVHSDTWESNGQQWVRKTGPTDITPGPVEHAAAAYDEQRGRVVVFGGGIRPAGTKVATVGEWDGQQWTSHIASGPSARVGHSLVWSPAHGAVVLYGGFDDSASFRDLWMWDGSVWNQLNAAGPTDTEGLSLAADSEGLYVVGTGVTTGNPWDHPRRVWRFVDRSWALQPGVGPHARMGSAVAWDAVRKRLVVVGGSIPGAAPSPDTWEWDGVQWREMTP